MKYNFDFELKSDYGITDDSIQTGISAGKLGEEDYVYISLGHLEDFILNPEFGFTNVDNRCQTEKETNEVDENDKPTQESFKVEFPSKMHIFSDISHDRMII